MLQSIFLLNKVGDVIIEKHYRVGGNRTVCETFWTHVSEAERPEEVLPVIATPNKYLIHIYRNDVFYLATVNAEVMPLLVIEFLQRLHDTFADYFNDVNEDVIKENFVTVYQLLDEMMDNGIPLTTEPNVLKAMIQPQGLLGKMVSTVTSKSNVAEDLPDGTLSSMPWRKAGVKYASNEFKMDIIEEIDCIVDNNGCVITMEVNGSLKAVCKLSGMPDLTLHFKNPEIMDDCSFHPCVRLSRYDRERVVSFVPPDGQFELMKYTVNQSVTLPMYVKPQIAFNANGGRVEIMAGSRNTLGKQIESVSVVIPFPKVVTTPNFQVNVGVVHFDEISKVCKWEIGKIPMDKSPNLSGTIGIQPGARVPDEAPVVDAYFSIPGFSVSGLRVDHLDMHGESYRLYKGARSVTRAGKFQVRT